MTFSIDSTSTTMRIALTFAILAAAPLPAQSSPDFTSDLDALAEWVETEQGLPPGAKQQALARIEEFRDRPEVPLVDHYIRVSSVLALADNAHSTLTTVPVWVEFGVLPLRPYWFSDGWYVVRAREEHSDLLGARITEIEGMPVDQLAEVMRSRFTGGPIEFFREFKAVPLMLSPPVLHAAGLAASPDSLQITVTMSDGSMRTLALATDLSERRPGTGNNARHLVPAPLESEEQWVTLLDPDDVPIMGLRDHDALFRYEFFEDLGMSYTQLRSNIGNRENRIQDFLGDATDRLRRDQPRFIVLDNRFNPGGNLNLTARFGRELPSLVPDSGMVYVLTGPRTFSAGIYTSFFPEAVAPDRTLIVGTRVGDRDRFWAESRGPMRTPVHGWRMGYSLQMHDPVNGCNARECHLRNNRDANIAVGSLDPELRVPFNFNDYASGRDPAFERVLELIHAARETN